MARTISTTQRGSQLIVNIAAKATDCAKLLGEINDKWVYEDLAYRFYHQSFKVYAIQSYTLAIVALLQSLAPHLPMNPWFQAIVRQGTGKEFVLEDNERWLDVTRPMLEAFFHARFFLEMICKYGPEQTNQSTILPSGWAAVLYLFNLR